MQTTINTLTKSLKIVQQNLATNGQPGMLNQLNSFNIFSSVVPQSQSGQGSLPASSTSINTQSDFSSMSNLQDSPGAVTTGNPLQMFPTVPTEYLSSVGADIVGISLDPQSLNYNPNLLGLQIAARTRTLETAAGSVLVARRVMDPSTGAAAPFLSPVVLDAVQDPKATTFVNVTQNLNPNKARLAGAGVTISGDMGNIGKPILYQNPGATLNGNGVLMYGTNFSFASDAGTIEAVYRQTTRVVLPTASSKLCGASSVSSGFATVNTDVDQRLGQGLIPGATFRIQISDGGTPQEYTFTFQENNPNKGNNVFTNMQDLLNLIATVPGIVLSQDTTGVNMALTSPNPSAYVTFGGVAPILGFTDIARVAGSVQCFSNMETLNSIINRSTPLSGISARYTSAGIKIEADAKSNFKLDILNATQNAKTSVAKKGANAANIGAENKNSALTTITSVNHGLEVGDVLRVNLGAGPLAAVVVDATDNTFTLGKPSQSAVKITDAVNAGQIGTLNTEYARIGHTKVDYSAAAASAAYDHGAGTITLTFAAAPAGIAVNDVVYLSGGLNGDGHGNVVANIKLPASYYKVTAVGGGGNTITISAPNATDANVADAGVGANVLKIAKVGKNADFSAGDDADNSVIGQQIFANVGGGGKMLKFYAGGKSGLKAGQTVSFDFDPNVNANLLAAIDPAKRYEIKNVIDDYVVFEGKAPLGNDDHGLLGCNGGDIANGDGGVPIGLKVVYSDQTFTNLGIQVPQLDAGGRALTLPPLYNPTQANSGLTSDKFISNTVLQEFEVFNAIGQKQRLKIMFAKVSENNWVVELCDEQNKLLLNGSIEFLDAGITAMYDGQKQFQVSWPDGTNTSINLNFGKGGAVSLTQFVGSNMSSRDDVEADGCQADASNGFEIAENGIYEVFENGSKRLSYVLDLFTAQNPAGLIASGSGFATSVYSGRMVTSSGRTISGSALSAEVNMLNSLTYMATTQMTVGVVTGSFAKQIEMAQDMAAKLSR